MQHTEEQIKERVDEFRSALSNADGMGLSDDALSVSDESLRRLAIESLKSHSDLDIKKARGLLDPNTLIGR